MSNLFSVDEVTYYPLFTYAVLAQGPIAFTGSKTLTINNGYYATLDKIPNTYPLPQSAGGPVITTGLPSGLGMEVDAKTNWYSNSCNTKLGSSTSGKGTLVYDILNNNLPVVNIGTTVTKSLNVYPNVSNNALSLTFSYGSTIIFDAKGNDKAQFFLIVYRDITFDSTNFILLNGAMSNNIYILSQTGNIHCLSCASPFYGRFIAYRDITFDQDIDIYGQLFTFGNGNGQISFDVEESSTVNSVGFYGSGNVACYKKGTKILTKSGYVKIENLTLDNKVITKGKINTENYLLPEKFKLQPIIWISKFKVDNYTQKTVPVCIKKNALGYNYPIEDLYVSPDHGILIKGKNIKAKNLVNGRTIFQKSNKEESLVYYHIELQSHSAVIANGMLSESYLDVNNRDQFEISPKKHIITKIVPKKNTKTLSRMYLSTFKQ
jgi:hypothetical protein